jgi:Asp-tRNA(Asn)/Glu-tRNA(Gln) amidotransferase C subunit
VDYVSELPEATADAEPLAYPVPPLRADEARPGLDREAFLAQAPERTADAVVVPKVGDLG